MHGIIPSVVTISHPVSPAPAPSISRIPFQLYSHTPHSHLAHSAVLPPRVHLLPPTNMRGMQALWLAAQSGHLRTVKTLLSLGASPLKKSTEGVSPFFVGEPISARPNAYILPVGSSPHASEGVSGGRVMCVCVCMCDDCSECFPRFSDTLSFHPFHSSACEEGNADIVRENA